MITLGDCYGQPIDHVEADASEDAWLAESVAAQDGQDGWQRNRVIATNNQQVLGQLEAWKLRTRLELLEDRELLRASSWMGSHEPAPWFSMVSPSWQELQRGAQAWQSKKMQQLRRLQVADVSHQYEHEPWIQIHGGMPSIKNGFMGSS
eukprot:Skav216159  [mRNA]  locus=scaffold3788:157219:159447:+ [translate_table: standard]